MYQVTPLYAPNSNQRNLSKNHQWLPRVFNINSRTSLVVQWLRIHLPMQGTWVQSVVGEPTYHKATKPARPNYRSCNARTGEKHE